MKKKYGFTMIEILMIALVMWTALIWVLAVMKKMEQSNTKITDNVIATNLAVQWYELVRAQSNDMRYDSLLSLFWNTDDANALLRTTSRVHRLEEGKYYIVLANEKICPNSEINENWVVILASWTNLEDCIAWNTGQLRVILWAVCSGEDFKLWADWECRSWEARWEFKEYTGITLWSWVCLKDNWWIPCTWDARFHREIIVSQDVNRCGFGTWAFGESWQSIACEWTGENTIYRYRYGYNVCSRVFYNWQAWWQSRKRQVAEICAKIN
jgi:hypothetical protein